MEKNLIIIALCAIGGGGFIVALSYPYLGSSAQTQKRQAAIVGSARTQRVNGVDPAQRRRAIAETVKSLEAGTTGKKDDFRSQISQAGLSISLTVFWIWVGVFTALVSGLSYWAYRDPWITTGAAVAAFVGAPRWVLSFLRTRRIKKFIDGFPEAIDLIIRGVRAGLPVVDCFRMIANESPDPLGSEFRRIVEAQAVGLSIGEAAEKLADRIPTPETSFFAIVLNVQQKTGGNLSEALGNLATVLRDRKRMKEKVKAISSEAKASAAIIGALPFLVAVLVYIFSPDYIMLLFTTSAGNLIIGVSLVWMSVGIFVMRSMINFDI
jgi:tight adherence protein B